MAMENPTFIDDFLIETSIYCISMYFELPWLITGRYLTKDRNSSDQTGTKKNSPMHLITLFKAPFHEELQC